MGQEVSTRLFGFFEEASRRGLVDLEELTAGLPVSLAQLRSRNRTVSWDVWAEINERFARGRTPEQVMEAGRLVTSGNYLGPLGGIIGLILKPRDLYTLGARWFAPSSYRGLKFSCAEIDGHRLSFEVRIPEPFAPSEGYMLLTVGGLRALPAILGLQDAEVTVEEISGRVLRARIVPPRSSVTVGDIARRLKLMLGGVRAITDELAEQQQHLEAYYSRSIRSERGFRAVLDRLPLAVAVVRDDRLVFANPYLVELCGEAAAPGRPLSSLLHPEDRELIGQADTAGKLDVSVWRLVSASGEAIPFQCQLLPGVEFQDETTALFVAVSRKAEFALEESEAITRRLLDAFPDLIVRVSSEGFVLDVKLGLRHMGADTLAMIVGKHLRALGELIPEAMPHVEKGLEEMRAALESQTERSYEVDSVGGWSRKLEVRILPRGHKEAIFVARDLTERRELERQLAIAERMATIGQVAAGVAHDLNNPLQYVVSNVSLALEEIESAKNDGRPLEAADIEQLLRDARAGAARVERIAKDLRLFARSGDTEQRRPTDVREVVRAAIEMSAASIRPKAKLVVTESSTRLVSADPARLVQVFVNLLVNAAQAIPEGAPEQHRIHVTLTTDEDRQIVEVMDTGAGIPPDKLSKIFEPFFTTKVAGQGTGLGLSICQRLVSELGGRITAASTPGAGTTFTVSLPALPAATQAPTTQELAAPIRPGTTARILVVDDEPLIARTVARVLAAYDVGVARCGEEGLSKIAETTWDLVLCDLSLPDFDGLELRRRAIELSPRWTKRFVFVTGGALTSKAREAMVEEPERFIGKPVMPDELRARVAAALAELSGPQAS